MPRKTAIERLSRLPRRYFVEWRDFRDNIGDDCDLYIWIADGVEEYWKNRGPTNTGGRKQTYSDLTIEFILTLKGLFGFPLRQTVEFLSACFLFTGISNSIPDPSQVSRRARNSSLFPLVVRASERDPVHVFLKPEGVFVKTGVEAAPDGDGCWCRAYLSVDRHGGEVLFSVVSVNGSEAIFPGFQDLKSAELDFDRVESIEDRHTFLLEALNKGMEDALSDRDGRPFQAIQSLSDAALEDLIAPLRKGLWKKETGIFAKPILNVMVCRHEPIA